MPWQCLQAAWRVWAERGQGSFLSGRLSPDTRQSLPRSWCRLRGPHLPACFSSTLQPTSLSPGLPPTPCPPDSLLVQLSPCASCSFQASCTTRHHQICASACLSPGPVAGRNRVSSDGHSTWEVLNKEVLNRQRRECAASCLSPRSIPCPPALPPRSSITTSSLPHLPWEAFQHSLLGASLCSNVCSARVHGHAALWVLVVAVLGTQVCSECHFLGQQFRCNGSDKENQTPCT